MSTQWDPRKPAPRTVPVGFYLGHIWLTLLRSLALFAVMFFIALIRVEFQVSQLGWIEWVVLLPLAAVLLIGVVLQAWMSYGLLRDGCCVDAEVLDIETKKHKDDVIGYKTMLRWRVGDQEIEKSRLILATDGWKPVADRAWNERRVTLLVNPRRPTRAVPLHCYTRNRPRTIRQIVIGD